jgi:hypothetical protein
MNYPYQHRWISRLLVFSCYLLFSIAVYYYQGSAPAINIDHIAYIRLADRVISLYPAGDYWRAISPVHTFAVLMAYAFSYTKNHIYTLKLFLSIITFWFLIASEYFFSRFTQNRLLAVMFALGSAIELSFGTVFWGMTDFAASLNRSLLIPFILILLGWYFDYWPKERRIIVFPILVLLSLLHLGSYYILSVLMLCETIRLILCIIRQREAFMRRLAIYLLAISATLIAYSFLRFVHLSDTSLLIVSPQTEKHAPARILSASEQRIAIPIHIEVHPAWSKDLDAKDSWKLELLSQPWRNFPPTVATIVGFLISSGFLVLLAGISGFLLVRDGIVNDTDRRILLFAICVFFSSYGLQMSLWILRSFTQIYPINFEEVRTICFLALPLYYLCLRGCEIVLKGVAGINTRAWFAMVVFPLLFVRPITLIRQLPESFRSELIVLSEKYGILDQQESQRTVYARQLLNLETPRDRFYYSIKPLALWLSSHSSPSDRILSNRDDLQIIPATIIGTSNSFLNTSSASERRQLMMGVYRELDIAVKAHDLSRILQIAHDCQATYAVIPWFVKDSAYSFGNYSIIVIRD